MSAFRWKLVAMLACAAWLSASLAAAAPARHETYLSDELYKEAFERYVATLKEAEERLSALEFAAAQKAAALEMATSATADMKEGIPEIEAWGTAYALGQGALNRELEWDWLRRHPEGVQGFYRMRSNAFDGWLTVQQGDEPTLYAVKIYAVQKTGARNSGDLDGFGRLKGDVMQAVDKNDDQRPVNIRFKGDTATIAASAAFKKGDALGVGVQIDGNYLREKK